MKGKRLRIRPMAFVLLLWMLLTDRGGIALLTLAAAILHEGGHIVAAMAMRIPLRELRIDFPGARLDVCGRVLSFGEEWILCAAGPLSSLLLSLLACPLWRFSSHFLTFSCVSLLLGLLNLLPIRTFDGGRMLECFLIACFSERVSRGVMRACTVVLLFLLWAISAYFLLRVGDGLSLFCFSMSLFWGMLDERAEGDFFN